MKFYVDTTLSWQLASRALAFKLAITDWHDQGFHGGGQALHLLFAGRDQRALVTTNGLDYAVLTDQFRQRGDPHFGVIVLCGDVRQRTPAGILATLASFVAEHPDGLEPYSLHWLLA